MSDPAINHPHRLFATQEPELPRKAAAARQSSNQLQSNPYIFSSHHPEANQLRRQVNIQESGEMDDAELDKVRGAWNPHTSQ